MKSFCTVSTRQMKFKGGWRFVVLDIVALKLVWHIASDLLSCLVCWRKFPRYLSSIKTYIICLQLTSAVAEKSPTSALTSRVEPEKQETNKTVEGMWWCYKESPGTP